MTGFDLKAVERGIEGTRFRGTVHHLRSVGSTNALALEAAQAGAQGAVWVADEQTAGRGRGGHGWHSAAGDGLYVSVLVSPARPLAAGRALPISLATGIAAQAAIREASGVEPDIRWPNDLLLGGRKCGGILVETAVGAGPDPRAATMRYAVIGVGINLNHQSFPEELWQVATSVRMEAGQAVSREAVLSALLRGLDGEISALEAEESGAAGDDGVLARFARASSWVRGKRVRVDEGGGYSGVTEGLDERGFLRVRGDDGGLYTVFSGGVREAR